MNREWNDSQPIYRQLRDRGVHMILDGVLKEGDPLPSVRTVAAEFRVNPLTVLKAYQQMVDEQLVEMKRGLGMFVKAGARELSFELRPVGAGVGARFVAGIVPETVRHDIDQRSSLRSKWKSSNAGF
jgi:DNA-binding transcriptional regulator YhcF (GntR family)